MLYLKQLWGKLYGPDRGKYTGEFKDGYSNGKGRLTYSTGSFYVGEFKEDKLNGQGTVTSADGLKSTLVDCIKQNI